MDRGETDRTITAQRRRLTRAYGYRVCGAVLDDGRDVPTLCALPRGHDSPHLPPRS